MTESSEHDDGESFLGEKDLNACGATNRGLVRPTNQDQFLIAQLNKSMRVSATSLRLSERLFGAVQGEVLLVADGMGGHAAGEEASRIAIGHLVRRLLGQIHWHFQGEDEKEADFIANLKELLKDAHSRILMESARDANRRGMGTTLTMAYMTWPKLYVVHAGDSRCYLIRDGKAQQITTDHTLAHQLVKSGGMKPEDEATSKWSNVLWNVLGGRGDGDLIAEFKRVDLRKGDAIVLCSDGLHRYVKPSQIADVVNRYEKSSDACDELIRLANEAGGEDNITVVVSSPENDSVGATTWIDAYETTGDTADTVDSLLEDVVNDGKNIDGDDGEVDLDFPDPDPLVDTWPV